MFFTFVVCIRRYIVNKILKNSFSGATILLLFFLTIPQVGMAGEEVPLLPMTVRGVVLVDGTSAPIGTVVAAYLNGEQVEQFLVNTSSGDYCFWIPAKAEDKEKPVTFTVNGKNPEKSLTWESGKQILSFDLSVGTVADAGSFIKGFTSKLNSGSLAYIEKQEASGGNSKVKVIESSVPEPNVTALKDMIDGSADKEAAKSSDGSSKPKSAPGFPIISAIAGILLLAFGSNLIGK
jgi:hypothetical protein